MASILVVDDIAIMRNVIKRHLENMGHLVIGEAENGFDAFNIYKKLLPDIVTMDITMPISNGVKNGIDSLKLIIDFDSKANVIMVTSHGEEKLVMEALTCGAKGYLLKPVTEEKLKTIIDKFSIKSNSNLENTKG